MSECARVYVGSMCKWVHMCMYVCALETFKTSSGELSCSRAATKSLISLLSTFAFNLGQHQWNSNSSKQQVCSYVKEERECINLKLLLTVDGYVLTFPWPPGLPFLLE